MNLEIYYYPYLFNILFYFDFFLWFFLIKFKFVKNQHVYSCRYLIV